MRSEILYKEYTEKLRAMLTDGEMAIFQLSEREMCLIKGALDNTSIKTLSETWSIKENRVRTCTWHACCKLIKQLENNRETWSIKEERVKSCTLHAFSEVLKQLQIIFPSKCEPKPKEEQ